MRVETMRGVKSTDMFDTDDGFALEDALLSSPMRSRLMWWGLLALMLFGFSRPSAAHSTAKGNCHFEVQESGQVDARIDLTEEDILDLFDIDLSSEKEEPRFTPRMQSSMPRWWKVTGDQTPCTVTFEQWERRGVRSIRLAGQARCTPAIQKLTFKFGLPALSSLKLICLTTITAPGEIVHTAILNRQQSTLSVDVARPSIWETIATFTMSGAEHILLGWDHLAFLLGLLLLSTTWTRLLFVVSGFTLAHSVTLALGALRIVELPSVLVESLIALSIGATGAYGIIKQKGQQQREEREPQETRTGLILIILCFGFGLLHGLGFARMLQESLEASGLLFWPLVSFNIGVELGQIVVVLMVYPLLRRLKGLRRGPTIWFVLYGCLCLLGAAVTIQRLIPLS